MSASTAQPQQRLTARFSGCEVAGEGERSGANGGGDSANVESPAHPDTDNALETAPFAVAGLAVQNNPARDSSYS